MVRKLRALLLLPVGLFFWVIGWSLIWIDSKNSSKNRDNAEDPFQNDEALYFELIPERVMLAEEQAS